MKSVHSIHYLFVWYPTYFSLHKDTQESSAVVNKETLHASRTVTEFQSVEQYAAVVKIDCNFTHNVLDVHLALSNLDVGIAEA